MWSAHLTGDANLIHRVAKIVVRADWLFTATSGIVQPVSGLLLANMLGISFTSTWLLITYSLYAIALICWLPVVKLQMNMRDLAGAASASGRPLPPDYFRAARLWFLLGWPAFIGLLCIFYLMIAKPF
jgi:uncharacterized membrane protein